jgi:hypothetical protein
LNDLGILKMKMQSVDIHQVLLPTAEPVPGIRGVELDSIYFFMYPGWREELESNRWHWSKRWGQRLPVVMIQPELPAGKPARIYAEQRLANVEILMIEKVGRERDWLPTGVRQAGQIAAYMASRKHQCPLFWFYNPHLLIPYLFLPARARIVHATENLFYSDNIGQAVLKYYRYGVEISDLVICCLPIRLIQTPTRYRMSHRTEGKSARKQFLVSD